METCYNAKTVTVKVTRSDLCDMLIACLALHDEGDKWGKLHEKLADQLVQFDEKHGYHYNDEE